MPVAAPLQDFAVRISSPDVEDGSGYYEINGKIVQAQVFKSDTYRIETCSLMKFNLMGESDVSFRIAKLDSPKALSKVVLSPVASATYFKIKERYEDIDGALKTAISRLPTINVGDLVELNIPCHPASSSSTYRIYCKSVLAIDKESRKPTSGGLFDPINCRVTLLDEPVAAHIPPSEVEVQFNKDLHKDMVQLLSGSENTILLYGMVGAGKRTLVRQACETAGLNLLSPRGQNEEAFQQNIQLLLSCNPYCIMIRCTDYLRYHYLFKTKPSVITVVIHDEIELKNIEGTFARIIRVGLPSKEEALAYLNSQGLGHIDSELIRGLNAADLRRLSSMFPLRRCEPAILVKEIRDTKSVHLGQIPKVSWDEVAGLDEAKTFIRETIRASIDGKGSRTGLLLYGPPGTGKTLLAKAVANEYQMSFMAVKGPELMSMYVGETESNIRDLFAQARLIQPSIIFFDELDSLAAPRGQDSDSGGVTDRIVAQLMIEMDRLQDGAQVFLIGATNRPDLIDPALLRPGRIDKAIHLGLPDTKEQQIAILHASCSKMKLDGDVDFAMIVDQLSFMYSPADLANIARQAMRRALTAKIRRIEAGDPDDTELVIVTQQHFLEAIPFIKTSCQL